MCRNDTLGAAQSSTRKRLNPVRNLPSTTHNTTENDSNHKNKHTIIVIYIPKGAFVHPGTPLPFGTPNVVAEFVAGVEISSDDSAENDHRGGS